MYRETTYKQFYTYKCTYHRCAYIYKLFLCVYCNGDKNTALCLFSKWRPTHILTFAFCLKQAEKACNLPSSECEKEQTLNMYIHMHTCVYTYICMHVLLYPTLSLSAVNRRDGLFLCSVLYFTMSCISPLLAIVDVFLSHISLHFDSTTNSTHADPAPKIIKNQKKKTAHLFCWLDHWSVSSCLYACAYNWGKSEIVNL